MFEVTATGSFDPLSPEYRDLFARSDATAFQHPLWLHHLHGLARARDAQPLTVLVRTGPERRLVLALPLVRRGRLLRRVEFADLGVCDYTAPVCDLDFAERVEQPALRLAIRQAIGPVDLVSATKVASDPARMGRLLGAGGATRLGFDTHRIPLHGPFPAWRREKLAPEFARHLARKRKRLAAKGPIVFRDLTDPDEITDALARMREFRRARFAHRRALDLMQEPAFFEFYRSVAIDSAVQGGPGRTVALTVAGELVAASFGLDDDPAHLFILVGFDFERFRNYSLGLLIVESLIEDAIARGRTTFDLTVGDEPYKADFAAEAHPIYKVSAGPTWRGQIAGLAAAREVAARRIVKRVAARLRRRA